MLSQAQRTAILELNAKGVSKREIARVLQAVAADRAQSAALELHRRAGDPAGGESRTVPRNRSWIFWPSCKGNLVRVHEELVASGAALSYPGADGILPQAGHRANADCARGPVSLRARRVIASLRLLA